MEMKSLLRYGHVSDGTMAMRCCKVLLSFFLCFGVLFCCGQALLLDPCCPDGSDIWKGNNGYNYNHLKSRISYLCPVPGADANSKYMKSFKRVSKSTGESVIISGNYVRKTCLSVSYDKDWVDWPNEETKINTNDNIDNDNPYIVYAYSTGNSSSGYEICYWVNDGINNDPGSNDDQITPKLVGNANQLFQIGSDPKRLESIDLSGWDFSGVTSFRRFFSGCTSLKFLNMGTPNLQNLTNIEDMFKNCSSLFPYNPNGDFQNLVRSWYNVDINVLKNLNAKASRFKNIDVETANGVKYKIIGNGDFTKPTSGSPAIIVRNADAIQRRDGICISWDVLYENKPDANPGVSYDIEYLEGGKNWVSDASDIINIHTTSVTAEISDLKSYNYTYTPASPETFEGVKQFRIKTIQQNGAVTYTEPFTMYFDSDIINYPLSYTIKKKCGETETDYYLYPDDEGTVTLLLSSSDNCQYIIPEETTLECTNLYVGVTSLDYCNAKFINKGTINATGEIVLTNSKNTSNGIQYDCNGVYKSNNITFQGSLPEIKGVFNIDNLFTTVSNGQGQDITIGECATIHAYEGDFQHSGGAMKLYIDGEMTVERLIEGNMIHVRDGGMLIVGETDFDPSLKIVSYSGSVLTLCYNPTSGVDNLGFCAGTVFYNDNVLEYGWSTNPLIEGDINEWTVASDSHSSEYNTAVGIVGKNPIKADIGSPAFHSYSECIDPSKTHELLGIADDPFLPKDKKISPLYNKNCCSEEFSNNKIQIREFGNKWFRLINGELIYCENDN